MILFVAMGKRKVYILSF